MGFFRNNIHPRQRLAEAAADSDTQAGAHGLQRTGLEAQKTPETIYPWTTVSAADIRAKIDSSLTQDLPPPYSENYLSIRRVLADVFDDEALQEEANEILDNNDDPMEILRPFLEEEPRWLVRCSVTDSMVSGVWGLMSFTIGGRGYLYHMPNYGEGSPYEYLPILSAWEPIGDAQAFRASFLDAYTKRWDDFCLPPCMGQWAKGPFRFMLDAVCAVLREDSSAWSNILARLYKDDGRTENRKEPWEHVVEETAKRTAISSSVVSDILRAPWKIRPTIMKSPNLAEPESRVLVAAFLVLIGRGGF
jgi:hypothetical protein